MIRASGSLGTVAAPVRVQGDRAWLGYTRFAAVVTAVGYSLGYSTIGFGLLFIGAMWRLVARRRFPWARTALDWPLAAFGAVLVLSAAASPYHPVAVGVTFMLVVSAAVYFGSFVWLLEADPLVTPVLLRAWTYGAVIAAVVGLFYSATNYVETWPPGHFEHARAQIPRGVGPNGLGTTLLLGSILALGGFFNARGWRRAGWAACSLLTLVALVATGSRSSLAGWIIGAGYLVYRELRARPKAMIAAALAGALLVGGIAAATPQLANRIGHTMTDVAGNRERIWTTSFHMIAARPLLGTGFGTFETAYDRQRAPGMSSEPFAFNLWLNLAVETGLLGLAAAVWIAAAAVTAWRRSGTPEEGAAPAVIGALWVGLLVDQFADNTLFSISTSAALWLLLALVAAPWAGRKLRGKPGNVTIGSLRDPSARGEAAAVDRSTR
jgi:O-antigen ligase